MSNTENTKEPRYRVKSPGRGGFREGAGRPKGSTTRIKLEDILDSLEAKLGHPYSDQVAENYLQGVAREDWALVREYDRVLINKGVADKQEIDVTTLGDSLNDRRTAFETIISKLKGGSDAVSKE